ncbi:G protein-coupled receptor GPR1 [Tolypocladium ophioglossoides CBS 100239]|uniref:G protein-coupled receptor GPR1 n=1 Tax=Tolypocladium ophioglossoides (strain CBS 100239) TaxID=1163406 RepID=A0A0L0N081_TOLOC|nr:G protein-coupled receptor GPR1 [Tolypocladium ophioglossoides CBS 100239]
MPLGRPALGSVSGESWLGVGSSLAAVSVRDAESRGFSQHQLHVLRLTSLVVASVSVAATMLATFCLIILLIQSDMLKATWFVVLSAVELARGTVASDSAICQTSGFFLALGIEACDVAVVLLGLHTALYIFRGGNGLYPCRYAAYWAFVLVPLLLASLAFVHTPAFANSGPLCYLPTRPGWTRLALSWVPRYVIIVTICVAYVSTYVYVNFLMKRFGRAETARRGGRSPVGDLGHQRQRTVLVPPTSPVAHHGLMPPTPPCENGSADRRDRKRCSHARPVGRGPHAPEEQARLAPVPGGSIQGKMSNLSTDSAVPSRRQDAYLAHPNLEPAEPCQSTLEELPPTAGESTPRGLASTSLRSKSSAPRGLWSRPMAGTAASSPSNMRAVLHRGPRRSVSPARVFLSPAALDTSGMAQTRDKIRRQIRQLFIYPVVNMLVWIVPFINHVIPERKSSFGLVFAGLVSLCLQGIADSLVFSILEKPWRHPRPAKGSRWRSWCVAWPGQRSADGTTANVGRTREEMLVDSRIARRRHDEELAERRRLQLAAHTARREWWDVPLESVGASGPKASDDGGFPWQKRGGRGGS